MSEIELYNTLEKIVQAAEANERDKALEINREFSTLLINMADHFRSLSIEKQPQDWYENEIVLCDRVRNLACYSISNYIDRESLLREMKERFSKIPKP